MPKNKQVGVPKSLKGENKQTQFTVTKLIIDIVHFIEVARVAIQQMIQRKQVAEIMVFKINSQIEFAINILRVYMGVEISYLQELSNTIVSDENFQKDVDKFCKILKPGTQGILVTSNLEQEMKNLMGRDALLGGKSQVKSNVILTK